MTGTENPTSEMQMVGIPAYTQPGLANEDGSLGIDEHHAYFCDEGTWSQSTHCCTIGVDVETGHVRVLRYVDVQRVELCEGPNNRHPEVAQ